MRYEIKPILSGAEIRRVTWCRHSARPHELCSDCDRGELHLLSLTDEELEVMLRGLTFAADFQDDYYTLYPSEDYNSGNDCKHARGERILARLRAMLTEPARTRSTKSTNTTNAPGHLFTPRLKNGMRLSLRLSDADWEVANRFRGTLRVKGVVTDQTTGKRYRIKGASCGLPCCCDSTAEGV